MPGGPSHAPRARHDSDASGRSTRLRLSEFQVVSKTTACAAGATAQAPLQWTDCDHDAASSCTGAGLGAAGLVAWLVPANQAPDHVSYYLIAPGGSAGPSW